jgi:hypothetical protein
MFQVALVARCTHLQKEQQSKYPLVNNDTAAVCDARQLRDSMMPSAHLWSNHGT